MKKIAKSLTVLLLVTSIVSPSAFAKSEQAKESLVAVGDSIPFGYNLGQNNQNPAKSAYPYLIGASENLRVRNLGIPGWQSEQLLSALQTDQKYRQAVIHADYVAITIGNNDLLQILREAGLESGGKQPLFQQLLMQKLLNDDVFANIAAAIAETRSLTDAPIVLYNVYNPFQLNDPLHYVADPILPGINQAFAALAASNENVYVADAYAAFGDNQAEYVIQNDIHPTAAGQQVLADIGIVALNLD
ncbi:GDSL-type esterase/lipase family protein [Planomicrobium okeanokoites]|uniref:GDSL-type esterase/lipase family protein n=1 Tax=Planomicrobium okeanokoites TaxID=244 RepID=UPI0015C47A37|nr:GDSL-type esterase/lipase family protein [Planomicrobium okeanokoites]